MALLAICAMFMAVFKVHGNALVKPETCVIFATKSARGKKPTVTHVLVDSQSQSQYQCLRISTIMHCNGKLRMVCSCLSAPRRRNSSPV